jgi:hypothetical protein
MSFLKPLGKWEAVLLPLLIALLILGRLVPLFRPACQILGSLLEAAIVGDMLVWFIEQVRNYPPPLN